MNKKRCIAITICCLVSACSNTITLTAAPTPTQEPTLTPTSAPKSTLPEALTEELNQLPVLPGATEATREGMMIEMNHIMDMMRGANPDIQEIGGKAYDTTDGTTDDDILAFYTSELEKAGWYVSTKFNWVQGRREQLFVRIQIIIGRSYFLIIGNLKTEEVNTSQST